MKIERLEELQRDINGQRSLSIQDCASLIGEVWRLRTALTAKDFEVSYLRHSNDQLKAELDRMAETTRLLRADNDRLKAVHGLPNCYLENRWSNCAVRMRKRGEIDNNGTTLTVITPDYADSRASWSGIRASTNPSEVLLNQCYRPLVASSFRSSRNCLRTMARNARASIQSAASSDAAVDRSAPRASRPPACNGRRPR